MVLDFDEYEASTLADILMDYSNDTPEDDPAIQKLLAARDTPQDFTKDDLLLILDTIKEFFDDTAECLTPSERFCHAPATIFGVLSLRELVGNLSKRLRSHLSLLQSES